MSKLMKKVIALAAAMMLVLGMSATVFAASDEDKGTITVKNVKEATASVKAYKIGKATYDSNGNVEGYVADGVTISSLTNPTEADMADLISQVGSKTAIVLDGPNAAGNYTANVSAGLYLVLVEHVGPTIYNPMLVAASHSTSGVTGGSVDAEGHFFDTGYAKSIEGPEITKAIDGTAAKGDASEIGDKVNFTLTTTIPSYEQNTGLVFKIKDELAGLENPGNIVVKVGGVQVEAGADKAYTVTTTATGFEISFNNAFLADEATNGNKAVVVTYEATIADSADVNFGDDNTNTATLNYSNSPSDTTGEGEDDDKTYHHTFGIGVNVVGEFTGHELTKIDGKAYDTDSTISKLANAKFKLYTDAGKTNDITSKVAITDAEKTAGYIISDSNGAIAFEGIDANKTYYLVEEVAPTGYSAISDPIEVKIVDVVYNADGTLKSYSVQFGSDIADTYTINNAGTALETTPDDTTYVKNYKLGELPSTGGIGTYLFTLVGVLIMAAAVALFVMRRRAANRA